MLKLAALLGNTPALSMAELGAVYPELEIDLFRDQIAIWETKSFDAQKAIDTLGGIVKIFEIVKEINQPNPENLDQVLVEVLAVGNSTTKKTADRSGKIHFAIGEIGRDHLAVINVSDLKDKLKARGVASRFVEGPRPGLSASVLIHHRVTELVVIQSADKTLIGRTLAVQNIDNWTVRDREKPYADRKKGMLPPKVARMMVNLAVGDNSNGDKKITILDPFCGSGTVLLEAAMLGHDVIGSDLDIDSATGTRENLEWLKSKYKINFDSQIFQKDATRLQLNNKVTHLVTEPFLGKPTPKAEQLPNIFKGLGKLYLGAFKQWTTFLANGATLVVVFPEAQLPGSKTRFALEGLIDKLLGLGYTSKSESFIYHRPNAIIERVIHQFRFEGK